MSLRGCWRCSHEPSEEEKTFYQELGERFRMMRKLLGISEREAAEAIGTTVRTYRKWEMGGVQQGYWMWAVRDYCDAYGVSYSWLAFGCGKLLPDDDDYLGDLRSDHEQWKTSESRKVLTDAGKPFVTPVQH